MKGQSCNRYAEGECANLFKDIQQVKILVLRNEDVGKTTLIKRLRGEWNMSESLKSKLKGKGPRNQTDGVEMKSWKPLEMKRSLKIEFWDFAGQEIYYATHHFFLSCNSIFIIVFDCTKSLEENKLPFWFNSIQAMAPGSHIFCVGTHLDQIQKKDDISVISNKITTLIEQLWRNLPIHTQLKIEKFMFNGQSLCFCPLDCISMFFDKTELSSRYLSEFQNLINLDWFQLLNQ